MTHTSSTTAIRFAEWNRIIISGLVTVDYNRINGDEHPMIEITTLSNGSQQLSIIHFGMIVELGTISRMCSEPGHYYITTDRVSISVARSNASFL